MFRWRGGEISRIEGFSDGLFAVTLTLLIVSSSVPGTFHELWQLVVDLPVFLVSFAVVVMAWYYHYIYFRRYGLEDFVTVVLNAALLFLVLFFAFPLKFLFTFLWRMVRGGGEDMFAVPDGVSFWSEPAQRTGMMVFYGLGLLGVFGLLALMVLRAYALRDKLELDELERYLTLASLRHHLITVVIALISLGVLACGGAPGYAGLVYFLMGPVHGIAGWRGGRKAHALHERLMLEVTREAAREVAREA